MTAGFIVTLILCGLCAVIFGAYFYARATTPKSQERRNSSTHNAASPDNKIRKLRGAAAQRAASSYLEKNSLRFLKNSSEIFRIDYRGLFSNEYNS